jgi:acyl-CoA synthetase (AMP-forming)/AMP-acid ligase II
MLSPVYRDDPRLASLIGPGGQFEVEDVVLDGVPWRVFVRAPRTVVDTFEMGVARADLVHLVHDDERLTFADVRARALAVAEQLRTTFGVQRGDRVAIAMRNLPEFVIGFWGAAVLGAVVVPLNSWWTGAELGYALENAGARVAFLDDERLARVVDHAYATAVHLVGVHTERDADAQFDDLMRGTPLPDDAIAHLEPDDPVTILYTSGTTGRPKGALGTNRNHLHNLWNMAFGAAREAILSGRAPAPARQSATLAAQPMFHIGGIAAIIGAPMGGSKIVIMRKWDLETAMRLAVTEGLTAFGGVPAIARQIIEYPGLEQLDLDVRGFPMGGAAVPPDLPLKARERFGDSIQLLNGYGLTETTSAVVTNVGVEFAERPDSVGRPNLTADIKVVDPDDNELGVGEVGELAFRSPQVVPGYWDDEAATKAVFVDGWFHSGDVGYVDEDGFVYVVDRIKDVVIRGGENVYCAEVEAVLFEHPAVAEVAVVGVTEPTLGERVCAVVVPRPGRTVELEDLRAFTAAQLAAFKCPEALHVVDELPKTATEKVAKNVLRDRLAPPDAVFDRTW